jgi:thiamine-phosphate pyrophosphorylase
MTRPRNSRIRGLYAIADTGIIQPGQLLGAVAAAVGGGAHLVQYRDKAADETTRLQQARELAALCHQHEVLFLINDDVDLAAACGADGVHLGKEDAEIANARAALGEDAIIGASCYNELERARAAAGAGADYLAFGSFHPSTIKPGAVRAEAALLHAARAEFTLPLVAIGGITPENGAKLIAAGADALAVITGVFASGDVAAAAARYARLFQKQTVMRTAPSR